MVVYISNWTAGERSERLLTQVALKFTSVIYIKIKGGWLSYAWRAYISGMGTVGYRGNKAQQST